MTGEEELNKQVITCINEIRDIEKKKGFDPDKVYKRGDCGNLFYILKEKFPEAELYVADGAHIVTKIGDFFYDISGVYLKKYREKIVRTSVEMLYHLSYNYNDKYDLEIEERNSTPSVVDVKLHRQIVQENPVKVNGKRKHKES